MDRRIRGPLFVLLPILMVLIGATAAWADTGYGIGLLVLGLKGSVSFMSYGFAFALIVFIEGTVLAAATRGTLLQCLGIMTAANILSSLIGLAIGFLFLMPLPGPVLFFIIAIGLPVVPFFQRKTFPNWVVWTIFCVGLPLPLSVIPIVTLLSRSGSSDALMGILMLGFTLPNLAASILIEGALAARSSLGANVWKGIVIGNIISYILLQFFVVQYTDAFLGGGPPWQSRAKGTLRSIGSTQLAYQSTNDQKVYGSFQAMKDSQYIAEGYTLGDMIENYSMTWCVGTALTVVSEEFPNGMISTFTVIAYPRDTRPGFLNTFCITDDQVVRVYNPQNGNEFSSARSWDPIL